MKNLSRKDICEIIYNDFLAYADISDLEREFDRRQKEFVKGLNGKQLDEFKELIDLFCIFRDEREEKLVDYVVDFYRAFHR